MGLKYTGGAASVRDVQVWTVGGTIEVGDEFRVTVGVTTLQVIATTTVIADVVTLLYNAVTATTAPPEFRELSYVNGGAYITVTGPTDGKPVSASTSLETTESGGGAADTQTFVKTVTYAGTGPYDWANADNWDTGAVPVNADELHLGLYPFMPRYNISTTLTGLTINIYSGSTANMVLGLPTYNTSGGYVEYMNRKLVVAGCTLNYGLGDAQQIPKVNISVGTANTTNITVTRTNARDALGNAPLYVIGGKSDGAVAINGGFVDLGIGQDDIGSTGSFATLKIYGTADCRVGKNVTIADIDTYEGSTGVEVNGPSTNIRHRGNGTALIKGDDALAIMHNLGSGTVDFRRAGAHTNIKNYGVFDLTNAGAIAPSVANVVELYKGCSWLDPHRVMTYSTGRKCFACKLSDVKIDLGYDFQF